MDTDLKSIALKGDLSEIDITALTNNYSLETIDMSECKLKEICANDFCFMENLKEVILPNGIKKISPTAFRGCYQLEKFVINKNNLNYYSEEGCLCIKGNKGQNILDRIPSALSGVFTTPNSVKRISFYAFDNCKKITSVIFQKSILELEEPTFYECNLNSICCNSEIPPKCIRAYNEKEKNPCKTLIVPNSAKATYANSNYWNNFLIIA